MDSGIFESRVIELMFKSDARMIPQLVSYRVGCPADLTRKYLDALVTRSILTMEVDDKGVIYYDMPGRPTATNESLSWTTAPPAALVPSSGATSPQHSIPQQIAYAHPNGPVPFQIQINNVPAPPPQRVIVMGQRKSVGLAVVAALFFGPLGMIYATGIGALIMFFINVLVMVGTAGAGLLITLPIGAIWAGSAASQHNAKLAGSVTGYLA